MQPEICHQNSQHFYPSEPFQKNHITMRHPVLDWMGITLTFHFSNELLKLVCTFELRIVNFWESTDLVVKIYFLTVIPKALEIRS